MAQTSWKDYLKLMESLTKTLEELTQVERDKNAAASAGDLRGVEDCMKREQVLSLTLRGYDQKRDTILGALGLKGITLRQLVQHSPDELRLETKDVAEKLRQSIRGGDIAARVGGDEFLIFLEYKGDLDLVVSRIFESLCGTYEDFTISVSMGIAPTATAGCDYDMLFHSADQALYTVKRGGRGQYRFYDESMKQMLSVISPIDSGGEADAASAD